MKRLTAFLLALVMLVCACGGCGTKDKDTIKTTAPTTKATTPATTTTTEPPVPQPTVPALEAVSKDVTATLNEVVLSDYTIVYAANADAYTVRAATYIRNEIYTRTGAVLNVITDDVEAGSQHEIVVGETNRPISATLDADTEGLRFAMLAENGHIAMEGNYFIIAAAAYFFVATYVTGEAATVPATVQMREPIVEKANNYIVLIGDGMGLNHTLMPEHLDGTTLADYSDGEKQFYGYLFPHQGFAHTNSLNNTTESAASATALATGYKTKNGYVGRGADGQDLKTLTELAGEMGMSTAIMSTEVQTGATPAGFSAHADDRDETENILASQKVLQEKYGTIIDGDHDVYTDYSVYQLTQRIASHLDTLKQNEKGFFMMYEEAYIDKHSHEMDVDGAAKAVLRFNQAIATFMEFAFYNPDTFILITADHETGGLGYTEDGGFQFSRGSHTGRDVPVFAYGADTEVFHDKSIENVQIPKTIAKMWGQKLAEDTDEQYPPLN
ncbi:MAG: alkaline phosphatase [Clostridia bacterium]|nr:alkaline phosphatase [Clostridia bacterium]